MSATKHHHHDKIEKEMKDLIFKYGEDGFSKGNIIILQGGGAYQGADLTICKMSEALSTEQKKKYAKRITTALNTHEDMVDLLDLISKIGEEDKAGYISITKTVFNRVKEILKQVKEK